MPIKPVEVHPPNFEVLKANLSGVDPNDPSRHIPHKVYDVNLSDLLAGRRYEAFQLVAWRYIFRGEDQRSRVAEIGVDEVTDTHTFHLINMGSHVNEFIALCDQIEQDEKVREKDYEINLVRASACYVMAVWFIGAGHEHEFFVPLAPVHSLFEAGRHYEADEFMDLLEEAARDMVGSAPAPLGDDLTRIEGVGPKTAALLREAGILSFADLANARLYRLQKVLSAGGSGFNLADPSTWSEQASLAAAGKWDELQKLQDTLKGGSKG